MPSRKVARIVHLDPRLIERVEAAAARAGESFSERLEFLVLAGLDDPALWAVPPKVPEEPPMP